MYRKTYIYRCPIEREYKHLFGVYPDDDFMQLRKTIDYESSDKVVHERIDKAWYSSKLRHEKEMKDKYEREQRLLRAECPF